MFETGRRSAISSSELGLYSDRADHYNSSKYSSVVKKFVIVIMAIVAVILAGIFVYDFASGTSASSKVSQETKHIYILQNALKKTSNFSRRITTTTLKPAIENMTIITTINERSDNDINNLNFIDSTGSPEVKTLDSMLPETRSQNLENFKLRQSLLESAENDNAGEEEVESKQLFDNHAVVYRVRQMYHHDANGDEEIVDGSRPTPFHFKFQDPTPTSFHRPKFPQLTQYRYPYTSRNIQDIIKYLTNDVHGSRRGIKFTGVYVNPNKYDLYPGLGEMVASSDKSEFVFAGEDDDIDGAESSLPVMHNDPFFPYKPKHPADVNLLAPANVRFSPSGLHRYNPYFESFLQRPIMMRPRPGMEASFDTSGSYSSNYGKKRKPKPFSVMLDIYPITEINDPPTNKKASRLRPITTIEDYSGNLRRPLRANRYHTSQSQPIPIVAFPANAAAATSEEEEKQQMIFHLNLYPRKKNKLSRKDILQRSEMTQPEEHRQFVERIMSPFNAITKQLVDHSTIQGAKLDEQEAENDEANLELTKYEESFLEMPNEEDSKTSNLPLNHKEDEREANTTETGQITQVETLSYTNIDSVEGFQKFADGLIATD